MRTMSPFSAPDTSSSVVSRFWVMLARKPCSGDAYWARSMGGSMAARTVSRSGFGASSGTAA